MTSGILLLWLSLGLGSLLYFKPSEKLFEKKTQESYRAVLSNKTFLLYLVPWLMFSLINDLASKTIYAEFSSFPSFSNNSYVIYTNLLAGICAIIWGFLADKKGRKRLALIGFALLGIGYAALGLFPGYEAALFYVVADGIAWGAFTMLFITTLWGDIAQYRSSEKYYVIGVLPYLFSNFAGASMGTFLSQSVLSSSNTVFSFASFFLFAATLPLFYAPETLPEKIMKDQDLKSYIENAQKRAFKLNQKKRQPPKEENIEPSENDNTYEEAKKLAEKYY
jgi:MFS family permease